ncbi:lipoyl(octanoyl) transferase LipB [Bartonella sp. DGB1]|uniref:lipoyl(octanoyl) transferase LipB n=1 Tax=Bartonella sp. DGB1 TaxID=3239807 RepID=UPI003523FCAA
MSHLIATKRTNLIDTKELSGFFPKTNNTIEWKISDQLVDYHEAVEIMEERVLSIQQGKACELIWLLEHPPLYSAGTSAKNDDLLLKDKFPVYYSGRGGEFTYHGPGQRIVYILLDLKNRQTDIRLFIAYLEKWIINSLADFNIKGETREDRVGVWVTRTDKPPLANNKVREDKIAAIGVRVKKWVTMHGFAININPNLSHYTGIIPCGISEYGITSFEDLGYLTDLNDVDLSLKKNFIRLFTHKNNLII